MSLNKKKEMIHKSENLIKLLETDGEKYYEELCKLKETYNNKEIKAILDCTHYISYFGHHLHALIHVVGDLVQSPKANVYGTGTSVSENLGKKILEEFIKYDVDFDLKNSYKETPLQNLNGIGYTERKNNINFKKKLEDYYINRLDKTLINIFKKF